MIEYQHNTFGTVIVIGHALLFEGGILDMRDSNWLNVIKNEFSKDWEAENLKEHFETIIDDLESNTNWGNAETSFENAETSFEFLSKSMLNKIRCMVALNNKYPETLSKDSSAMVRVHSVKGAIAARNIYGKEAEGDWLDAMVKDESEYVRAALCAYKKKEHLDVLINDDDVSVRVEVATHTDNVDHLKQLSKDKAASVRLAVVKNDAFADYKSMHNDSDEDVRNLAIEGYLFHDRRLAAKVKADDADALLNSKDWAVRETLAMRGIGLEKLISDPSYKVRAAVARQGYGLDILMKDSMSMVRNVAIAYPAVLMIPE